MALALLLLAVFRKGFICEEAVIDTAICAESGHRLGREGAAFDRQ